MLTTRLQISAVLTACLIGPASPAQGAALTVAQTRRIDVHPGTELALNCGDGTQSGVVQYWHTPFGQLRNHGDRGDLDLDGVAVRSDDSLFAARASERHSGLYYCLLVAAGGTTLWPYQVNIGKPSSSSSSSSSSPNPQMVQGDQGRSRPRRDLAGSSGRAEEQAGVTDGVFAGAVAASVVLSFALGFVTGALSRAHVLRCLEVASRKVRSLRRGRPTGRGFGVTMTTLPDTSKDCVFYEDVDSPRDHQTTVDTTCSSSCMESPPPPAKPQRSFRHNKRREDPQPTADLEGCDAVEEEEEEEEVREDERRDGRENEVEAWMNGKRKEWEPEEKYVEEGVEVRMTEERRESKREEEEEQIRDEEEGDREGEPGEEVEERTKERKEGEPEEKYVEERPESKQEEEEQIRDEEEEGDREGEPEEEVEERMKERSREGETGEKEVEQLMEERRESREEVEERSGIRGEEGDREGEPGEKEVEERRGNMREEEKEVEERIVEKRESREGEAGVTGEESRVSGDWSPMVIVTEGNSEAGGRGETGRKSEGMAEGKEVVVVVVEEQMETASAGQESQNEQGVEEEGEISSEDDSSSDTSSSDTEDERKRDEREDGSERVNENHREGAEEQQEEEEGTPGSGVTRGRRSRVIRLYQYDDEGHRYSHLPSPAPSELGPTPRLKQRSLSLTRLNAIMAAATAGPMGPNGETGREECPSPPFSPAPDFKMDF